MSGEINISPSVAVQLELDIDFIRRRLTCCSWIDCCADNLLRHILTLTFSNCCSNSYRDIPTANKITVVTHTFVAGYEGAHITLQALGPKISISIPV